MAARAGITRDQVLDEADALLAETGRPEAVTLSALARSLGVRAQSLYAHVDGAVGLRSALAARSLDSLAEAVTDAAVGRSGLDAVAAVTRAHLDVALSRPGHYAAAIHPPGDDPRLITAVARVSRPLEVVLADLGCGPERRVHLQRLLIATVYGFALLHRDGQLTLAAPPADTSALIVTTIVAAVAEDSDPGSEPRRPVDEPTLPR